MLLLNYCRAVLPLAGQDPRLQTFIGTDMLRGSLAALSTTRSTAGSHQGDVLGLIRDILVQQLATQPGPRQVSPENPLWKWCFELPPFGAHSACLYALPE